MMSLKNLLPVLTLVLAELDFNSTPVFVDTVLLRNTSLLALNTPELQHRCAEKEADMWGGGWCRTLHESLTDCPLDERVNYGRIMFDTFQTWY